MGSVIPTARMSKVRLSEKQQLFWVFTLATFTALTLVRLLTSELHFLSYFQSLLWAAHLLGLGVGCLNALVGRARVRMSDWFWIFGTIVVLLAAIQFTRLRDLAALKDGTLVDFCPQYLTGDLQQEAAVVAGIVIALFLVVGCFVSLGLLAGSLVARTSVLDSLGIYFLAGVLAWVIYSLTLAFSAPAAVLVCMVAVGYLLSSGMVIKNWIIAGVALCCSLSFETFVEPNAVISERKSHGAYFKSFWAPEYHVQTYPLVDKDDVLGFAVTANHSFCQMVTNLQASESSITRLVLKHNELNGYSNQFFAIPYFAAKEPKSVLILGAGAGNEVRQALSAGAVKVDAVDGRGWLFKLAELEHQMALSSPKVRRFIMDPRLFLKSSHEKYDLIVFGLLDGPPVYSPYSVLSPDSFVYTVESFADAREHLNPNGYIALAIKPVEGWYVHRAINDLRLVFGGVSAVVKQPFRYYIFASLTPSQSLGEYLRKSIDPKLIASQEEILLKVKSGLTCLDDWPFEFILFRGLARPYLLALVLFMAIAWLQIGRLMNVRTTQPLTGQEGENKQQVIDGKGMCVLLSASAYMLCSVKATTTLAFNFGATWQVAVATGIALFLTGAASYWLSCLKIKLPVWILWPLILALLGFDYLFNYAAIESIPSSTAKVLLGGFLPLALPFGIGVALFRVAERLSDARVSLALIWFGLTLGAVFSYGCFFIGIAGLNVIALVFCLAVVVLGLDKVWMRALPKAKPVIED